MDLMARPGEARLKDAVRDVVRRGVNYHGQDGRNHYAVVLSTDPLMAELTDDKHILVNGDPALDDDLLLCQNVRLYDSVTGIEVDDTLIVSLMVDGKYVAHAVLSDNDVGA